MKEDILNKKKEMKTKEPSGFKVEIVGMPEGML
jgi:hypothetical protein